MAMFYFTGEAGKESMSYSNKNNLWKTEPSVGSAANGAAQENKLYKKGGQND